MELSRVEHILKYFLGEEDTLPQPLSRVEALLIALGELISSGAVSSPIKIKGRVDTVYDLPSNAEPGWMYYVGPANANEFAEYVYLDTGEWQYTGTSNSAIDISLSTTSTNPVENRVITEAINLINQTLSNKVDKVAGKGLSTEDFTTEEKAKLSSIETGANANVQADWNQTDSTADDFIKNKPDITFVQVNADWNATSGVAQILNKPNIPSGVVVDLVYDSTSQNAQAGVAVAEAISNKVDKVNGKGLSTNDYTDADKTKLEGIAANAEANVQSDWNQNDSSADDFIKNKPTITTANDAVLEIQKNGAKIGEFTANASVDTVVNITVPVNAVDVNALPASTKYGASLSLSIDNTTYVITAALNDQDGETLGMAQTIDLPLESVVVNGSYDDTTQKIILTLNNGTTVDFSVADLVSGLQTEITTNNKLDADLVDDSTSTNKFVTAADKTAWNAKSDFSGSYDDLTDVPEFATVATTGSYNDLADKPVIPPGAVVDQTFGPTSQNAQSGTAVAEAIAGKVDKETGKGLSSNDFTSGEKSKLAGIETGANANVQADWNQTDDTADDFIKNKPTIPAAQVNADWDAVSGVSQILNKPTIPTVNDGILTIQKNGTSVGTFSANAATGAIINITVPVDADDVSALPDTTKYGASLSLSINSTTYVVTASLKDQDGNTLGTAQSIDLPLETVVVGGSYDDTTKKVILTLKNGTTVDFSVADLVAGLQTEITSMNKLSADLIDDSNSTHKFVTAAEKIKISNSHEWTYTEVIGQYDSTSQSVLLHHQAYDEDGNVILDDTFPFDKTFPVATTTQAGTMSAADKTKLDGIASGAQANQNAFATVKVGTTSLVADSVSDTLTITAGSNITLTPTASSDSFVISATDTTYGNATTSTAGLMSASDKTKLNDCATINDVYGLGTIIANNSDLNDFRTPGVYAIQRDADAATIVNAPMSTAARIEVFAVYNSSTCIQRYTVFESGAPVAYERRFNGSSWGLWYKFEGTAVT